MKEYIKIGDILIDNCNLLYLVLEIFKNTVVVEPFPNKGNLATEIMSFDSMEKEGWTILSLSHLTK